VELRVAVARLRLPPAAEARLRTQQKNRLNKDGELVIQAEQFRSQLKNRRDALERLTQMIEAARERPKRRVPTRPTAASKRRRIDTKKQRGQLKSQRQKPAPD
jgi:ribosome-associated protein